MAFIKRLELGIEEFLLIFLLFIEVLDFFAIIPPELEFLEKSLSLIAMPYLFYKVSITRVIFGRRERFFDAAIVISWALISINKIVGFAISVSEERILSSNIYTAIAQNFYIIEKAGFIAGVVLLLVVSFLLIHEPVERRCLMQIIHEQKKVRDWKHLLPRFFIIYLVLLAAYLLVYNFAIEWLASTVDAPLMMVVLLAYLVLIVKHGSKLSTSKFLNDVSEKSEEFYERFITLFHDKKTVLVALTGILVLHLLVDIGHFIIPYVTGIMYTWYFAQMGPGHMPLFGRMTGDLSLSASFFQQFSVVCVYILNIVAILLLFIAPAYLWWCLYTKRHIYPPRIQWLFFGSMVVFLLMPVFSMAKIDNKMLMGVDMTTNQIAYLGNVSWMLLAALGVMGIFWLLERKNPHRTAKIAFGVALLYFAYYIYLFFADVSKRYIEGVVASAHSGQYFVSLHLLLFLTITIAFYVTGFLVFAYKAFVKQKV
jgi:hypothetical protein